MAILAIGIACIPSVITVKSISSSLSRMDFCSIFEALAAINAVANALSRTSTLDNPPDTTSDLTPAPDWRRFVFRIVLGGTVVVVPGRSVVRSEKNCKWFLASLTNDLR